MPWRRRNSSPRKHVHRAALALEKRFAVQSARQHALGSMPQASICRGRDRRSRFDRLARRHFDAETTPPGDVEMAEAGDQPMPTSARLLSSAESAASAISRELSSGVKAGGEGGWFDVLAHHAPILCSWG